MKKRYRKLYAILLSASLVLTPLAVSTPSYADAEDIETASELPAETVTEEPQETAEEQPEKDTADQPEKTSAAFIPEETPEQEEAASQEETEPAEGAQPAREDGISAPETAEETAADSAVEDAAVTDGQESESEADSHTDADASETKDDTKEDVKDRSVTASESGKQQADGKYVRTKSSSSGEEAENVPIITLAERIDAVMLFAPVSIDNYAALEDGEYTPEDYTFTGGTGKAKLTCEKVIVTNHRAMGVFTASSTSMTHVYLDTPSTNEGEITELYDPDKDAVGSSVYQIEEKKVTIPVKLNTDMKIGVRTVAMSAPHWIAYTYNIKLTTDPALERPEEEPFDNTTEMDDGTYSPAEEAFSFAGGTGKAKLTLEKVVVKNQKATAVFRASSKNMTHIYLGESDSSEEVTELYDPKTDQMGFEVYAISNQSVEVPVRLNEEVKIAVRTTAMSSPHWVNYTYQITVTDEDKQEEEQQEPDQPGDTDPQDKPEEQKPTEPVIPTDTKTLAEGTYKVDAMTYGGMFYLVGSESGTRLVKCVLEKKNGKMFATIVLSGTGYDYVYMGTPEEAVKAGQSSWIPKVVQNGYYTYRIPVAALDQKLAITPRSASYASQGRSDAWRPGKTIIFYSANAEKISGDETVVPDTPQKDPEKEETHPTSGTQTEFQNDNKAEKESSWTDDSSKSTSTVDNRTTLPDGVYTPSSFSWSGGSGKLAYIRCNKITVRDGRAYATIEFSSNKYDALRANGRVYSGAGVFTIPVKLNANNKIIGRTTAMSQPHWVEYTFFIALSEGGSDSFGQASKNTLSEEAPEIAGLQKIESEKVEHAEYFRMFEYEQGIRLLEIDVTKGTPFYQEEVEETASDEIEYDEEGKPVAKSQNEITMELYRHNIVNYMLVPEDTEIPAGLEKDYIIVRTPAQKSCLASQAAIDFMIQLGVTDQIASVFAEEGQQQSEAIQQGLDAETIQNTGTMEKPDYRALVKLQTDLCVLPASVLPVSEDADADAASGSEVPAAYRLASDGQQEELSEEQVEEMRTAIETMESRFTALGVPVLIDRSESEKTALGQTEWIKVYGALFGCEKEAKAIYEKAVKDSGKQE